MRTITLTELESLQSQGYGYMFFQGGFSGKEGCPTIYGTDDGFFIPETPAEEQSLEDQMTKEGRAFVDSFAQDLPKLEKRVEKPQFSQYVSNVGKSEGS